MSSIRLSLEKLNNAVGKLDSSVTHVENALQDYPSVHSPNNVNVDVIANRLDKAIGTVENLLKDEE